MKSCTRTVQSFEFKINDDHYLSIADLPGIGESELVDVDYVRLYCEMLDKSDVVVYVLRADARDYSVDESAFRKIFPTNEKKRKVVLAVNCCDKIEPINRRSPFAPTKAQIDNLTEKINTVKRIFSPHNNVVHYSAKENWNVSNLVDEVVRVILLSSCVYYLVALSRHEYLLLRFGKMYDFYAHTIISFPSSNLMSTPPISSESSSSAS